MDTYPKPTLFYPDVERHFFYTSQDSHACFAWEHLPISERTRHHTVIICPPIGYEYTHSHRSLKHFADYLAAQGFAVLRFDYQGTGDSAGTDLDENRIETWINNIVALAQLVHEKYPDHRLTLVGLRLGATLAALATQQTSVDHLILWEPIVKGSSYVREQTAIARMANDSDAANQLTHLVESAGFLMSDDTLKAIKQINLSEQEIRAQQSILVVARDDRSSPAHFAEKLLIGKTPIEEKVLPGYADMLAEPQDTKVPLIAIHQMTDWLLQYSSTHLKKVKPLLQTKKHSSVEFPWGDSSASDKKTEHELLETPFWYEPQEFLFAISTQLKSGYNRALPAIILMNSGAVHHVGPNRVYIEMARQLAMQGFYVVRMDIGGLGDCASGEPGRDNHPYQHYAVDDAFKLMQHLRDSGLAEKFVVGGICSGAYHGFHCALKERQKSLSDKWVQQLLLINPLCFYWHDSMSLATSTKSDIQVLRDRGQYSKSMRDPDKWKKLFSGKVSFTYLAQFLFNIVRLKITALAIRCSDFLGLYQKPLTTDLGDLVKSELPIQFIFSSTDPGLDIVKKDAPRVLKKGLANQVIHLTIIDHANHTFSKMAMRQRLLVQLERIAQEISTQVMSQAQKDLNN